jgi:16S rRNA (uracil1498-N3)-methyltransferase
VYLFQGLPKADKMEMIIQKCVELGVYAVVPVATKRCVVKLDDKKSKSKIARWQGIAEAAAKQSKRRIVPEIMDVMSFRQALQFVSDFEVKIIPYELAENMEKTKEIIQNIKPGQKIAVFIGPEGGFDESEVEQALQNGTEPITLGKRILRTETAGLTVMSWIMYQLEN